MSRAGDEGEASDTDAPATGERAPAAPRESRPPSPAARARPREIGGQEGPEPTRYGDWEKKGRCTDF